MNSAICTLFEGHYHYGVATLSNSLYKEGFRGTIYVGYRGDLPNWALVGKKEKIGKWKEAVIFNPIDTMQLVFLPLDTNYSLTNYKPNFMLELWEGPAKDAEALFYFDPDIVICDSWICYEQWVSCGVALCEDVNSPLPEFHPRRQGWRTYYNKFNINLQFKNQIYANGGYIGLIKKDISFLYLWLKLQDHMAEAIGGLENSIFTNQNLLITPGFQIFDKSDQDALNATAEAYNGIVSYIGKEGMGFDMGKAIMFHALGSPKPWNTNILLRAISGKSVRYVDISYWYTDSYPILVHSKFQTFRKKMCMKTAKAIGRFYKV
jgi:hypothetical protein